MKKLISFKDLPLVNSLWNDIDDKCEYYDLNIGFDEKTKLVQVIDNAPPSKLFPDDYVYDSSQSETMKNHFKSCCDSMYKKFGPSDVLEIGSNSGIFIRWCQPGSIAVEPCSNFAQITNSAGLKTYDEFWSRDLAKRIVEEHGKRDLIFSANTISHIQDLNECFKGVYECLTDDGVFVVECPSFLEVLKTNAFDQFYHEHQSYFTSISFSNILKIHGFKLFDIEWYPVHGGTYRFFACKNTSDEHKYNIENLYKWRIEEEQFGVDNYDSLLMQMDVMKNNMKEIKKTLIDLKSENKKIIGYGASAKFIQVSNMCDLNSDLIDYVVDTTPDKQDKFTPKSAIKIIPYDFEKLNPLQDSDYCFLGAWNYKDEIIEKENEFIKNGGKFITHIPFVEII